MMKGENESSDTRLHKHRREYGEQKIYKKDMADDPIIQFKLWLDDAIREQLDDPTAMVLATVDAEGKPNSRVVLLKGIIDSCFIFYTNYQSKKAQEIVQNNYGALNFYWSTLNRQVRVRGTIRKTTATLSDQYFSSRPKKSQIAAFISHQSETIENRDALDEQMQTYSQKFKDKPVPRPDFWGGYQLNPDEFEFWQGRDNRLHDRIFYQKVNGKWEMSRLAP